MGNLLETEIYNDEKNKKVNFMTDNGKNGSCFRDRRNSDEIIRQIIDYNGPLSEQSIGSILSLKKIDTISEDINDILNSKVNSYSPEIISDREYDNKDDITTSIVIKKFSIHPDTLLPKIDFKCSNCSNQICTCDNFMCRKCKKNIFECVCPKNNIIPFNKSNKTHLINDILSFMKNDVNIYKTNLDDVIMNNIIDDKLSSPVISIKPMIGGKKNDNPIDTEEMKNLLSRNSNFRNQIDKSSPNVSDIPTERLMNSYEYLKNKKNMKHNIYINEEDSVQYGG